MDINRYFAEYYERLYSSNYCASDVELSSFLDPLELPVITLQEAEELGADITLQEIQGAIASLAKGKVPGTDGLPAEFFATYSDLLAPKLVDLYKNAQELGRLPVSTREALVVPLHKPGRPESDHTAYRPLSMLNIDYKILSRILATRLLPYMPRLIHRDQTGFIPSRNTAINIRRLLAIMDSRRWDGSGAVVMAIDLEKAFDSLEWAYLYEVMERFGLGGDSWPGPDCCTLYQPPESKLGVLFPPVMR